MATVTPETHGTLHKKLNDLISINIDSVKGFEHAIDEVDSPQYKELFRSIKTQREANVRELRSLVASQGETPEDSGSLKAKAHRWWLDLRANLSSNDDYNVLAEAERGEDAIKNMYEEVMEDAQGSPAADVIQQQYGNVKSGHDRVRDLRDAEKAAK